MSSTIQTKSLKEILSGSVLDEIDRVYFSWPTQQPLDQKALIKWLTRGSPDTQALYKLSFDAFFRPLSKYKLSEIPDDFLEYIGDPKSPTFPRRALAVHVLLDQVTRMTFESIDQRWINEHFDILDARLANQLDSLPELERVDSIARWMDLGCSFEQAFARVSVLYTSFTHSEDLALHARGQEIVESLRRHVEQQYGVRDPLRDLDLQDRQDIYAFPRLVREQLHYTTDTDIHEIYFNRLRISRVHEPILQRFGRYPHRNAVLGRENTAEEAQYLEDTKFFGVTDEKIVLLAKADRNAGQWTPLKGRT